MKKWFYLGKSDYIGIKTRAKLIFKFKIMRKYGSIIGFVLGFVASWVIFKWQEGKIIDAITSCAQELRMNTFTLGLEVWTKLSILKDWIMHISPYGRISSREERFLYVLNWSSGSMLFCSAFCAMGVFAENLKKFLLKVAIVVIYGFTLWYIMFALCFLLVKIPIYYEILAAIAVIVLCIFIGFIALFPVIYISEKLNT